jgi:hypothetical protein
MNGAASMAALPGKAADFSARFELGEAGWIE